MSDKKIDWEHLKWKSFTNQFQAFKREHPDILLREGIRDLKGFAEWVVENKDQVKPRTVKRANFYLNVILRGGKLAPTEVKHFLEESYNKNAKDQLDGYILDKSLSSDTAKVYHNPTTGQTVVAHRGTSGLKDWANNVAYAVGAYKYTDRYKKGKKAQEGAEKKYGKENISTLGHSQSGVLARELGKDTKEIINVNPAYRFEKPAKNEYTIRSSSDIVSAPYAPIAKAREYLFPKYSKKRDITIQSKNPADILREHSYDILDRLPQDQMIGRGLSAWDIDWHLD